MPPITLKENNFTRAAPAAKLSLDSTTTAPFFHQAKPFVSQPSSLSTLLSPKNFRKSEEIALLFFT
jgi:hypothetical protein